jgi:hypothetical protein
MQHFFASNWNYRGVNQTDRVVVPHRKDNRGIMQSRAARMAFMATSSKQTAVVKVQRGSGIKDHDLRPREWKQFMMCPVTGRLCKGDLAYLCPEYGCARKGGLSPRSEENF